MALIGSGCSLPHVEVWCFSGGCGRECNGTRYSKYHRSLLLDNQEINASWMVQQEIKMKENQAYLREKNALAAAALSLDQNRLRAHRHVGMRQQLLFVEKAAAANVQEYLRITHTSGHRYDSGAAQCAVGRHAFR